MMQRARTIVVVTTILGLLCSPTWTLADTAQYNVATPGKWLPLTSGTQAFGPTDRYVWDQIPSFLSDGNFYFWQTNPGPGWPGVSYGSLSFTVSESGMAYLAVSTRFGGGGNSSGGWLPEVSYLPDLEADGWQPITTGLTEINQSTGTLDVDFLVLQRNSLAGESFTYRTEKYVPPVPLVQSPPAPPSPTQFVIDPLQSSITATIVAGDLAIQEQAPGSLTTQLAGTLSVDLNTAGKIQFVDAGGFTLANQPGLFEPGSAPAQLAGAFFDEEGVAFILGAARDLTSTLTSGALPVDAAGNFTPNLVLDVKSGGIDYSAPSLDYLGSNTFVGTYGNQAGSSTAKLETIGNQQKLTIPFTFVGQGGGLAGLGFDFSFSGQIVAYAVPEPSACCLALSGVLALLLLRRFR